MNRISAPTTGEQATWALLLVALSALGSAGFACVTPFAAFAVAAGYVLPPRPAVFATAGVWLANQAVGFGYLHYPWDRDTILWGLAIGAAAIAATLLASVVLRRMQHNFVAAAGAALVAAFAVYEAALFLVALVLGGVEAFTPAIIGQFALLNLACAVGFVGFAEGVRRFGMAGAAAAPADQGRRRAA